MRIKFVSIFFILIPTMLYSQPIINKFENNGECNQSVIEGDFFKENFEKVFNETEAYYDTLTKGFYFSFRNVFKMEADNKTGRNWILGINFFKAKEIIEVNKLLVIPATQNPSDTIQIHRDVIYKDILGNKFEPSLSDPKGLLNGNIIFKSFDIIKDSKIEATFDLRFSNGKSIYGCINTILEIGTSDDMEGPLEKNTPGEKIEANTLKDNESSSENGQQTGSIKTGNQSEEKAEPKSNMSEGSSGCIFLPNNADKSFLQFTFIFFLSILMYYTRIKLVK